MKEYNVTGMSCAACSARVEKAVSEVSGVTAVSVSLLTNSVQVEGDFKFENIKKAVEEAGYGIKEETAPLSEALKDTETPRLKKRLIKSVVFLTVLMYFSMGPMLNIPQIKLIEENQLLSGIIQLVLTLIVLIINRKFFINGIKGLIHLSPNMDTLVAIGAGASFIYSAFVLVFERTHIIHKLYFESAAMIVTLITVGKMLEAHSKGKTTNAIKGLMALSPDTACVLRDGKEIKIPSGEVKKGNIFVIRTGDSIPVDGIVIKGGGSVNEAALTGESIPSDKNAGDKIYGGTVNLSGYMECEALFVGEDTALSNIIKMVKSAAESKAPVAKMADRVSGIFVPLVMGISLITFIIWKILGCDVGIALSRAISVLVISCPCALGLATPVAIMVGSGLGAKNGLLFKKASSLEECGKITTVVLDKTGTVTKGEPEVTDIIPFKKTKEELISLAYSLEIKSEHPLSKAIIKKAEEAGISPLESYEFKSLSGMGLSSVIDNSLIRGGNYTFISQYAEINSEILKKTQKLSEEGKTPLFFSKDSEFLGIIAVSDTVKEDSLDAIAELKNMGIRVIMLTGDNEKTARAIGKKVGIDEIIPEVMPDGKEKVISELMKKEKVGMVGDGINDAPALTRADIGFAIGAGTDIAIDSADIVLTKSTLSDVPKSIRLSRATLKNIKENLFWSFIYNIIGIPLAAGVFINITGWELTPMFGAAAMSLSSFSVVSNSLRLNFIDLASHKKDRKVKRKERKIMEKIIKVEGMMCPHCEAHVKKALEAIDGVIEVTASHTEKRVKVTMEKDIDISVLKAEIEKQGYTVTQ